MKNLTKVIIAGLLSTSALAAFADGAVASSGQNSFALKIRGGYAAMSKSVSSINSKGALATNAGNLAFNSRSGTIQGAEATLGNNYKYSDTTKFKNGFGVELAANYFITNNFAIEGSVGYIRSKVSNDSGKIAPASVKADTGLNFTKNGTADLSQAIAANAANYDVTYPNVLSSKHVGIVPLNATVQYHFAPDQSFKPYVGVGYGLRMVSGSPKGTKIKNAHGIVLQAGADIAVSDSMNLNVDVKHSTAKHKITYSGSHYPTLVLQQGTNTDALKQTADVQKANQKGEGDATNVTSTKKVNLGTTTIMAGVSFPF